MSTPFCMKIKMQITAPSCAYKENQNKKKQTWLGLEETHEGNIHMWLPYINIKE